MVRLKKTLLLLLTVVLIVHFATAQMDDEDDQEPKAIKMRTTKKPHDMLKSRESCIIINNRVTQHRLYMKSASNDFLVAYASNSCEMWRGFMHESFTPRSKECSEWMFYSVKVAGKTYHEIYNIEMKKYVGVDQSIACGNYEGYSKTNSTLTLFTIEPFYQGIPVYIKSFNGEFLSEPMTRMSNNVALYKYKKTHWVIRCK